MSEVSGRSRIGVIAFRVVGGIAVVVGSFFATLFVMDRFSEPSIGSVSVMEATYGANCGAKPGNLTAYVVKTCGQTPRCSLPIDVSKMGDPAPGCVKNFSVKYSCRKNSSVRDASASPEASGKTLDLNCQDG
jgi:hypothetical protein